MFCPHTSTLLFMVMSCSSAVPARQYFISEFTSSTYPSPFHSLLNLNLSSVIKLRVSPVVKRVLCVTLPHVEQS